MSAYLYISDRAVIKRCDFISVEPGVDGATWLYYKNGGQRGDAQAIGLRITSTEVVQLREQLEGSSSATQQSGEKRARAE